MGAGVSGVHGFGSLRSLCDVRWMRWLRRGQAEVAPKHQVGRALDEMWG